MYAKMVVVGRLVRDPKIVIDKNGKRLCFITVAHNTSKENTEYYEAMFSDERNVGFLEKYFKKGDCIGVEGVPTLSKTEANGKFYASIKIMGIEVFFTSGKTEKNG